ncbi:unnamed protein product, partial [Dovyalis caffra]
MAPSTLFISSRVAFWTTPSIVSGTTILGRTLARHPARNLKHPFSADRLTYRLHLMGRTFKIL